MTGLTGDPLPPYPHPIIDGTDAVVWRPHEPSEPAPEPIPAPPPPGRILCGAAYPDGGLCKVPAEVPHGHVVALDLHGEIRQTRLPVWSVEARLNAVLHRPILARDLAATLPAELGARLCDRLETLAQQARAEATVELSTAVVRQANEAIERLTADVDQKRRELTNERFGGSSRLH